MAHGSSPSAVCAQQCLDVLCYHSPGKSSPCPSFIFLACKHRWVLGPASFFSLLTTPNIAVLHTNLCRIFWNLSWKLFLTAVLKSEHALIDTDHAEPFMSCEYLVVAQIIVHLCCNFSQPILLVFFSLKREISLDASVSLSAWNKTWSFSVIYIRSFVTWHRECLKELVYYQVFREAVLISLFQTCY